MSFLRGSENHFFIKLRKPSSSMLAYFCCDSKYKTLDSTLGAGIKLLAGTRSFSVTKHFLAIISEITDDLDFFPQSILSPTSRCISMSISLGACESL